MKNDQSCSQGFFVNFFLGLGLALFGFFIGHSIEKSVETVFKKNYVSVKGLVDNRLIKSDNAELYFSFDIVGNNSNAIVELAQNFRTKTLNFCKEQKILSNEIEDRGLSIEDRHQDFRATQWDQKPPEYRYKVHWSVHFDTNDVEKMRTFYSHFMDYSTELMKEGDITVRLGTPTYSVRKLDDVRAEMIAAATQSARKAAMQFAADSGCQVSSIRHADQGNLNLFDIGDGVMKRARLVSYIDYYLK